ncbi:MAG: hypothetical protein ACRDK0_12675, partial [Solirubrobacteraceae bacterium]
MSVHYDPDRHRFVVLWREDGRQRSKRFVLEDEAVAVDASMRAAVHVPKPSTRAGGDGVYAYATKSGVRYRFVFRLSDGTLSSRRGFVSRPAAAAARRKLMASIERCEVVVYRETFGVFWERFVKERRVYLTAGSHLDLVTHGRKRLVPFFGEDRLSDIDADRVREWRAVMVALVDTGEISAKTAKQRAHLPVGRIERGRSPWAHRAQSVRRGAGAARGAVGDRVPPSRRDRAVLGRMLGRLSPTREVPIATGARVSEAVAVLWTDLDLDAGAVRIHRQRDAAATRITKGKRFRSVQIGPRLVETLRALREARLADGIPDDGWVFLCPR